MDPAIARAQAYVDALAARCAADPHRPRLHYGPPSRWMNDPNGTIRYRGWYHVFYHLNPFGDQWGFMHWGHARSRDLVHWEHRPIALAPDVLAGEKHCYSGCIALDADGTPRLLYTSVPFADQRPYEQWRCSPLDDDLDTWQRDRSPLLGPLTDRGARDPYVFRWQGRTLLVLGDGRRVPLFEAEDGDLGRIVPRGVLWEAAAGEMDFAECPNVIPLPDGRVILLLSPFRPVEWRLGAFDGERLAVTASGRLDEHQAFYATNTVEDDAGRSVVLGWVRDFPAKRGWNGCLAFPRLLAADGDMLRQSVHPAIDLLFGPATRWDGAPLAVGDACRLRGRLRPGVCLVVHGHELAWDGAALMVDGGTYPLAATEIDLDICVDRSVIEVFADGGRTVVTRVRLAENADGQLRGDGPAELTVALAPQSASSLTR